MRALCAYARRRREGGKAGMLAQPSSPIQLRLRCRRALLTTEKYQPFHQAASQVLAGHSLPGTAREQKTPTPAALLAAGKSASSVARALLVL